MITGDSEFKKQKMRNLPKLFKSEKARNKARRVWAEFKGGDLHHGGTGKVVREPSVARAIMFSEAERAKEKARGRYKARE